MPHTSTTRPDRPYPPAGVESRTMSISDAIKAEIERQGLTAYRVARMAGIKPDVVSRFLSGERDVELLPHRPDLALAPEHDRDGREGDGDEHAQEVELGAEFRCCHRERSVGDGSATTETSPPARRRDAPMSGVDRARGVATTVGSHRSRRPGVPRAAM